MRARRSIIEDYVSFGDETPAFSNAVTELVAGGKRQRAAHHDRARASAELQFLYPAHRAGAAAPTWLRTRCCWAARWCATTCIPSSPGKAASASSTACSSARGRQHLDNYMLVEHASPHCASRQFYNGILDQHAHGVFHGRIIVHKDAQKTDAKQTNRNLLLSRRCADRHQAAARNLRRRREVHPRRHHRPDRGERAVLSPLPRH